MSRSFPKALPLMLAAGMLLTITACQPTVTVNQPANSNSAPAMNAQVKEFNTDSFMERKEDGSITAGFSLKEIRVKKGDKVRINVKNLMGPHDFTLDEFGVKEETAEGQVTVVEFTADKAGEFKYYCSKFTHRQMGQEGTLIVEE